MDPTVVSSPPGPRVGGHACEGPVCEEDQSRGVERVGGRGSDMSGGVGVERVHDRDHVVVLDTPSGPSLPDPRRRRRGTLGVARRRRGPGTRPGRRHGRGFVPPPCPASRRPTTGLPTPPHVSKPRTRRARRGVHLRWEAADDLAMAPGLGRLCHLYKLPLLKKRRKLAP